jgi:hypothetical protein
VRHENPGRPGVFSRNIGKIVKIRRFSKQITAKKVVLLTTFVLGLLKLFVANSETSKIKKHTSKSVERVQSYRVSKITIAC